MARNAVEILINLQKKGEGASEAAEELSGVDKAAKAAGAALLSYVSFESVKAAAELARLGAESIRTRNAFTAISGGADEAAERLGAMKVATRGALSEQQAMATANRLMQMGLASNAEELENVSRMAVRLGTAMGRDAASSIEEFSLLLANQSIPRLDTFGISAGKVRERIAELQAATPGLTREMAFMQAVTEEGTVAMDRLGEAVEDEALAFERLEATGADLKAELGERLAPAFATAAEAAMLLLTWDERLQEAQAAHAAEVASTAATYEEYAAELMRAAGVTGMVVDENGNLIRAYQVHGQTVEEVVQANFALTEAGWETTRMIEAGVTATDGWAAGMGVMTAEEASAAAAARDLAAAEEQAAAAADTQAKSTMDLASSLKEATSSQIASKLIGMLDPSKMGADAYGAAVQDIGVAFGTMDAKSIALAANMGALAAAIEAGVVPTEEADEALTALIEDAEDGTVAMEDLLDEFGRAEDEIDPATDALGDLNPRLQTTADLGSDAGRGLRDAGSGMRNITQNAEGAIGGLDGVGQSAGAAAGPVGDFADELGTTEAKLQNLVAGSPWEITVTVSDSGRQQQYDIPMDGGLGGRTSVRTDNRQYSNQVSIINNVVDPLAAAMLLDEQRRRIMEGLEREF